MPDGSIQPERRSRSARRADLLPPGLVPLYLSCEQAAAYLGVSPATFTAEVAQGWWPGPIRRGARDGAATWYRPALERRAEAMHDAGASAAAAHDAGSDAAASLAAIERVARGRVYGAASLDGGARRSAKGR
jgi:hypothetical protein